MNYNEKLDKIVSENNGYLTSAMAVASGVNRQSLSAYVKNNNFERVARGIFISESVWPDYYYILFLQK